MQKCRGTVQKMVRKNTKTVNSLVETLTSVTRGFFFISRWRCLCCRWLESKDDGVPEYDDKNVSMNVSSDSFSFHTCYP